MQPVELKDAGNCYCQTCVAYHFPITGDTRIFWHRQFPRWGTPEDALWSQVNVEIHAGFRS